MQPNNNHVFILNVKNLHWILLTNLDPLEVQHSGHVSIQNTKQWFMYDCMNDQNNAIVTKPIMQYMYPERSNHFVTMVKVVPQVGVNDCGLFSLAYVYDLSRKINPSSLKYDQKFMRLNYNNFIKHKYLNEFKSWTVTEEPRELLDLII